MSFEKKIVKGVLLDITGVLVESSSVGDGNAICGSPEAVQTLREMGIPVRFVTNETQKTRKELVAKLRRLGFKLDESEVFPPALAAASRLREQNLKPYLLVHPNCLPDFEGIDSADADEADCVVLGDAVDGFSFANLNKAFRILMKDLKNPLISLGKGKYYREDGELTLDVGAFTAGLEFATQKESVICGKPSADFFQSALDDIGIRPEDAVMVGDDIESDVGGAQKCGLRGVLVRTGKFRASDETHAKVKPDKTVDNLAAFVNGLA